VNDAPPDQALPDALMLLAPGCPHCPSVLEGLGALVKEGSIGRLEVVNVAVRPEVAQRLRARGVPWVRIGPFELHGAHTAAELRQWARRAGSREGMAEYLRELLAGGRRGDALATLHRDPSRLSSVVSLLADPDAEMTVRLGADSLLEEFAGTAELSALVDDLGELSRHAEPRLRGDACHYLSLTGDPRAAPYLRERLADDAADVREIAGESLEALGAGR
jgi:thioredoxin-like negative regulator of GroEL